MQSCLRAIGREDAQACMHSTGFWAPSSSAASLPLWCGDVVVADDGVIPEAFNAQGQDEVYPGEEEGAADHVLIGTMGRLLDQSLIGCLDAELASLLCRFV